MGMQPRPCLFEELLAKHHFHAENPGMRRFGNDEIVGSLTPEQGPIGVTAHDLDLRTIASTQVAFVKEWSGFHHRMRNFCDDDALDRIQSRQLAHRDAEAVPHDKCALGTFRE